MTVPPSASSDWPIEVRRYLTHLTLQRALDQHEGSWQELACWLYAGKKRGEEERLSYAPTMQGIWSLLLEDAAAWQASRNTPSTPQG